MTLSVGVTLRVEGGAIAGAGCLLFEDLRVRERDRPNLRKSDGFLVGLGRGACVTLDTVGIANAIGPVHGQRVSELAMFQSPSRN